MTKKILLNWMPPAMEQMPSPAMSVLKSYLVNKGFDVDILYWNILLKNIHEKFTWCMPPLNLGDSLYPLMLYCNYLSVTKQDKLSCAAIKSMLMSIKPGFMSVDQYIYDRQMTQNCSELNGVLKAELNKIDFSDYFLVGMSTNLYQWVLSSIIAEKIKEISRETPIVVGGIGAKDNAIAFIDNFTQFDFAIWGEGEYPLWRLASFLSGGASQQKLDDIPRVVYRDNTGGIKITKGKQSEYIDLDSVDENVDFDDYFNQAKDLIDNKQVVPHLYVECSRSCHWKKCHFCYLNTGYKHRVKSPVVVDKQIRTLIEKYKIYNFELLDNDLIANDWERFSELLDVFRALKEDYPRFTIIMAEIITKGITSQHVRKMARAGFVNVQIGYESPSNELLRKIDKKNTFASNLLFIKYAFKYGINVSGANVIQGLLEETNEDIAEAIENLYFMRFFLNQGRFVHNMGALGVMNNSRYFKEKEKFNSFIVNSIMDFLPSDYISNQHLEDCVIIEKISIKTSRLWDCFKKVESHYITNSYTYRLYNGENGLRYVEYFNNEIINELEIETDSIEYLILKNSDKEVLEFSRLREIVSSFNSPMEILDSELFNYIEDLKREGLIYAPYDYSEILTLIDMENII